MTKTETAIPQQVTLHPAPHPLTSCPWRVRGVRTGGGGGTSVPCGWAWAEAVVAAGLDVWCVVGRGLAGCRGLRAPWGADGWSSVDDSPKPPLPPSTKLGRPGDVFFSGTEYTGPFWKAKKERMGGG